MKEIIQFNIFAENKEGALARIISDLAYNGVNIRSLVIIDREDTGEIRILVNDPVKAERIFKETNVDYQKEKVIAIKIPDKPGTLHNVTKILADKNININYIYPVLAASYDATICFQTNDLEGTVEILTDNNIELADQETI